tara:strand:- start:1970 stop:2698 length:729 start_codon:yes stop_codon:yes gene_type:complete
MKLLASQLSDLQGHEITDIVLHSLGQELNPATVLKVGACDGVFDDLTIGWINSYGMNVIYVEPIPEMCEKLRENVKALSGDVSIYECAVSDTPGSIEMCMIPTEYLGKETPNGLFVHPALLGMGSVWPPKNGLATNEHDVKVLEEIGVRFNVQARTLDSILTEASPTSIDLLSIDTEGHDWIILQQFDFVKYSPYWVEVEVCNMSEEDRQKAQDFLKVNGYHVYSSERDAYAIRSDLIDWTQ